jgi:hypothetical protein
MYHVTFRKASALCNKIRKYAIIYSFNFRLGEYKQGKAIALGREGAIVHFLKQFSVAYTTM